MSNVIQSTTTLQPEEVVQQLRALRDQIPDFVQLARLETLSLGRNAAVDPRLIRSAIHAVGDSEAIRSALGQSAEELRQDADFTARWGAVIEELQAMLRGVRSGVMVRRHRLGLTALQVYQISRQLARRKEHAHLLPHIAAMRQRIGFNRKRVKEVVPAQPQPEPSPGPQPEPSPQPQPQQVASQVPAGR